MIVPELEIGPKSFGAFEKRTPDLIYTWNKVRLHRNSQWRTSFVTCCMNSVQVEQYNWI